MPSGTSKNVAPPERLGQVGAAHRDFHAPILVERYGHRRKSRNGILKFGTRPNIDFLGRRSEKRRPYYELYDRAARAPSKRVSPRLRVGGPATAQSRLGGPLPRATAKRKTFRSTLLRRTSTETTAPEDVFGTHENIPRTKMVCRRGQESSRPDRRLPPTRTCRSSGANSTPAT